MKPPLLFALSAVLLGCAHAAAPPSSPRGARAAPTFELEGQPFCFSGASNYYAIYKPRPAVDDLFASARALGLKVLRVWGMLDRGSLDGSVPNADGKGEKDGVYFQYWDTAAQRPAYNDGPDGLQRLDYVLDAASRRGVRLIVVLTNNWQPFGGMDQYLIWYGRHQHHEFYTAPEVKQAYRAWLEHVITRKNVINGRIYREDPTIFGWELANEPRSTNGGAFDSPSGWSTQTLDGWAREMSDYVKSLDDNHLLSVGDEGFLNAQGEHFAYHAEGGVDHAALTALPSVDFGTFHLYPEDWHTAPGFAERWIEEHVALAARLGKPTLLEEYGAKTERPLRYQRWNDTLLRSGGSAALAWMLAGIDSDGSRYPDYDGFAFYRDDPTGKLLGGISDSFAEAPQCRKSRSNRATSSPFVRVRRSPEPVVLGWLTPPG